MLQRHHERLLAPEDERDLYHFLIQVTQEWSFFSDAKTFGLPIASKPVVDGITTVRNDAVDMWNHMMWQQAEREWWLVHQRFTVEEDFLDQQTGIFVTAGTHMIVVHRCESVLVAVNKSKRAIFGLDGREILLGDEEQVELHCALTPPHENTLKVLPINVVTKVEPFNH